MRVRRFLNLLALPLYVVIYGSEFIVLKLLGERDGYDWFGNATGFECLVCGWKGPASERHEH